MGQFIDLTGNRFGRLVVRQLADVQPGGPLRWTCECDCGTTIDMRRSNLRSGNTQSCGCLSTEVKRTAKKHGHGRAAARSAEYRSWLDMHHRCRDIDDANYGGRGISVCDRWRDFAAFFEDMGPKPYPRATIERRENNGNYEPSNCGWESRRTQSRNKRSNRIVEYRGRRMTLKEATELAGLPYLPVWLRVVRRGWPVERALSEPLRSH